MPDDAPDEFAHDDLPTFPTAYKESTYDVDNVYVAAVDLKGHSNKLYVAVPPGVKAQVDELIAARSIPMLRTVNDVFRDALIHRFHQYSIRLKEESPRWSGELEILARNLEIDSRAAALIRSQEDDERRYKMGMRLLKKANEYPGSIERARELADCLVNKRLRNNLLQAITQTEI
jgi:hypothetical protein